MHASMLSTASHFMSKSRTLGTLTELDALLLDESQQFGVERAASARIGTAGKPLALGRIVGSARQDWVCHYRDDNLIRRDPAAQRSIQSLSPFSWRDVEAQTQGEEDADYFFGVARDFGLRDGFVVPVHGGDGSLAVVTFSGDTLADDAGSKSYLHLLAIYFHIAAERLRLVELAAAQPALTPRQRECLKWVAAGKTDWEIGSILGLSEATINRHVERAKERLGVRTRVQAVVQAMSGGFMDL